jgi:hypothetical protein
MAGWEVRALEHLPMGTLKSMLAMPMMLLAGRPLGALFLQSQALAAASLTFIQVQTLQTPAGYRVLLKDCQLYQQGRCVLYWRT